LFIGFGFLMALTATNEMRRIDAGYRGAIERQATAAYVLANANRLLVSERDDIAEMVIDNTAGGDAADLSLLKFDQTSFAQSLSRAAALMPEHADGIAALQGRADQVIGEDCKPVISLASTATRDAAVVASQQLYRAACAPKFPALVKDVNKMQALLRNDRNAQLAALAAATGHHIRFTFRMIMFGFIAVLTILFYTFRPWLSPKAQDAAAAISTRHSMGHG